MAEQDSGGVTVGRYWEGSIADLCMSILETARIEAWIVEQESSAMVHGGTTRYNLLVRPQDLAAAKAAIANAEVDTEHLPEELATPPCPSCGSENTGGFLKDGDREFLGLSDPIREWMLVCGDCDHEWPDDQDA